jgi:hypothetical protein
VKDLKAIVIELGTMLEQRGNRDEALTLIRKP